jgi:hypothetical protein
MREDGMGACMGRRTTSEAMFDLGGDSWSLIRVLFQDFFLFIYLYIYLLFMSVCIGYKNIRGGDCAGALSTGTRTSVIRDVGLL